MRMSVTLSAAMTLRSCSSACRTTRRVQLPGSAKGTLGAAQIAAGWHRDPLEPAALTHSVVDRSNPEGPRALRVDDVPPSDPRSYHPRLLYPPDVNSR